MDKLDRLETGPAHALQVAPALIARRTRKLRESLDRIGALYEPEGLHRIRIAAKKLRYAAEVSADATGMPDAADIGLLKKTQGTLGRLHDAQVLLERVRLEEQDALSSGTADAAISEERECLSSLLDTRSRHLHARFLRQRPDLLEVCQRWTVSGPSASQVTTAAETRRVAGQ